MSELTPQQRNRSESVFLWSMAAGAAFVAGAPALRALLTSQPGSTYIGYQFNTDDHMVYSAWMRQAMDGHFFMDNRFATDPQPGLTVHLYFFLLGLLAKLVGLPFAANAARIGFTVLCVFLLFRLIQKLGWNVYASKLALALAVLGGGVGWIPTVWHSFGRTLDPSAPERLQSLMLGLQPTDVWQPEGFVLPSMLTNGLFMVSLCLILATFLAMLDAKDSWASVLRGAVAIGILMNIHSYDVLLIGIVLLGFLAACSVRKIVAPSWIGRALVITLGAVPAALWFAYVLKHDPVFQARAATETYTSNFRTVFFGYLPLMLLAGLGMAYAAFADPERKNQRLVGLGLASALFVALFVAAASDKGGYFLQLPFWLLCFAILVVAVALSSSEEPAWNLLVSWALLGMVALYFPGLFQRKLAMGLSIPWAILAAYGVETLLRKQERSSRNLATVLAIVVLGATSFRWFFREMEYIGKNVSSTTVQPVFLSADVNRIVSYLDNIPGRSVLIAMPGIPQKAPDPNVQDKTLPNEYLTPLIPDLNPIMSGLTGVYTYAGHWSETPDYLKRRSQVLNLFLRPEDAATKQARLNEIGATYIVAPVPEAFPGIETFDFSPLGRVVVDGSQFKLIELERTR